MEIPVLFVTRKADGERCIINEADFDDKLYTITPDDPLDHDGDGKKGGSLPADKRRRTKK